MATKKDEKAQVESPAVEEAPAQALIGIDDFLLRLEAADILKAGFARHEQTLGRAGELKEEAEWQADFAAFLAKPVN